jgi:hypothetical protein
MKILRTQDGQNIFDIALQETGSMEGVFDICSQNDIGIGEVLETQKRLKIDTTINRADIVRYLQSENIILNTGQPQEAIANTGFGFAFSENFGNAFNA